MHPEIEKLIELALANGQVTEKERDVIIRKASALGVDADEVEMILDARLYQLNADRPQPSKEKFGNIRTCPACGAPVNSLAMSCSECGHVFTNIKANSTVQALFNELQSLAGSAPPSRELATRQSTLITSFPIPNTKEDLFELLSMAMAESSRAISASFDGEPEDGSDIIRKAWTSKGEQALAKARLLLGRDSDDAPFLDECQKRFSHAHRNENRRTIYNRLIFALLLGLVGVMIWFMLTRNMQ